MSRPHAYLIVQRVPLQSASPKRVNSWRFVPGELVVRFEGDEGECCPICRCGRAHWLVHPQQGDPPKLSLTCHHCGNRVAFDIV